MTNEKIIEDAQGIKKNRKLLIDILIIIGIALLLMVLLNQALEYIYKMQFLNTPCDLCAKLNKNQSQCVKDCFIIKATYYPDLNGNWFDNTGKPMP